MNVLKKLAGQYLILMGFDKTIEADNKDIINCLNQLKKEQQFTSNIATLLSILTCSSKNLKKAGNATGSFLINSTIKILGLGNPAGAMGLTSQKKISDKH